MFRWSSNVQNAAVLSQKELIIVLSVRGEWARKIFEGNIEECYKLKCLSSSSWHLNSTTKVHQKDGSSLSLGEQLRRRAESEVFRPVYFLHWPYFLSQFVPWCSSLHHLHPRRLEKLYNLQVNILNYISPVRPSIKKTLPKAQRTRGLSSSYQSNILRSYHKFKHKSHPILSSESRLSIN